MTPDERFIKQLENYLDHYEGVTPLPESVRQAVRAELPRTKQAGAFTGPARYTKMLSTRVAQVALGLAAAAALIVAVGAVLYSGSNVGSPGDATPSPTVEATPNATAADVCEGTTVAASGLGGDTLDVTWCALGLGQEAIAFSMDLTGLTVLPDAAFPGAGTLWLRPDEGGAIALAIFDGQSVDDVVADLSGREGYAVSETTPVTIDGAEGVSLDISLAEGASSSDTPPLIADADQTWRLQEGTFTRVWIVDRDGETVMFATGQTFADRLGASLETLTWER